MGQSICSTNSSSNQPQLRKFNYLEFEYGQDPQQSNVNHPNKQIPYKSDEIKGILKQTAEKLNNSKTMYKDPSISTDRLVLKQVDKNASSSKNSQESASNKKQIEAMYLRPYKFLQHLDKTEAYKIIDTSDSSSSHIQVRDQIMQYFGVFLCFLADHPHIIQQIILTGPNTYGLHVILMNDDTSRKIPVYIDDYILCTNNRQGESYPLFSQPIKEMYLWPNLIEKAWFKTHGFMERLIERNSPQHVFEAFLDYPLKKYSFEGIDEFQKLALLKTKLYNVNPDYGYILTTKKDPQMHLGISGKKFLYLIGSIIYENKRLFYVRNPYMNSVFRGTLEEIPESLKKQIKEQFDHTSIAEGNFILEQSEFLQQISSFWILYYTKFNKVESFEFQCENNSEIYIQTELKAPGMLSLCLRQQSPDLQSNYKNKNSSHNKYSPITYEMIDTNTHQIVCGDENEDACFGVHNSYLFPEVQKQLPQSKYLMRIKKKDKKKHYFGTKLTLVTTFHRKIDFDIKNQNKFAQLFIESLLKHCQKEFATSKNKIRGENIEHEVFVIGDIICIYITKTNHKLQMCKVEIDFRQLTNLQLIHPQIDLEKTALLPQPLSQNKPEALIVFEKIDLTEQTDLGSYQIEGF